MKIIKLMIAAGSLTTAPASGPVVPKPWYFDLLSNQFLLIPAVLLVSFMFMGKGKNAREEKQRQDMLKQLKRGDRVQTIGGIQGAVMRAEENRVEVKVDEASNTKIWFARTAIARVLEIDGKAEKTETK